VKTFEIPLFPLRTVLVPGGFLPLQIFEPRYLDLVRECASNDSGFGVCLILEGPEAGQAPQFAAVGTLARIRDFNTLPNGLLGITAEGGKRFRVIETRSRDNGLIIGSVQWLDAPTSTHRLPESLQILAEVLRQFLDKVGDNYPGWHTGLLEDADWVGYRLTELLPLGNLEKQALLELDDPESRLQRILERLPDFQQPG
jgi:Lon protease-like protein